MAKEKSKKNLPKKKKHELRFEADSHVLDQEKVFFGPEQLGLIAHKKMSGDKKKMYRFLDLRIQKTSKPFGKKEDCITFIKTTVPQLNEDKD